MATLHYKNLNHYNETYQRLYKAEPQWLYP